MTIPSDPTLLCREAEDWAATLAKHAAACDEAPQGADRQSYLPLNAEPARSLASLLSQLATLARAASART